MYIHSKELRADIRQGQFQKPTSGQAPNYVQANLVVLPKDWAWDFLLFSQRNPKPCPILEVGDIGSPFTSIIAEKADIRTDIPKYRVYKNGILIDEPNNILEYWKDDYVFFLIGCSFTFEQALLSSNLEIRHISENVNVPMYKTNILCQQAGKFQESPMVVSMRPFKAKDVIKAIEITREYPNVHGSPVHIGNPTALGIKNINQPDFGEAVTIYDNEIPVFWACGVTPQMAALVSKPPIMITHSPGYMFVSDKKDIEYKI